MESQLAKRNQQRIRRALRVRKHVRGTSEKPRLTVQKSNQHLYAQLIDDEKSITLASFSTMNKGYKGKDAKKSKEAAKMIGAKIAEIAKGKQIKTIVFDRGRLKFHGIIAELANAARESGLQF